jgi:hypothetical protein
LPAGGTVRQGANVELGDVVKLTAEKASFPIYRHNGRFAEMVSAEMAGRYEGPIYGTLAVGEAIARADWGASGCLKSLSTDSCSTIRNRQFFGTANGR